ncbi:hypothetical protein [Endozoicomonas sp. ALB091]|uniref:hypothetical protein n=1 Tax=Endozoicomonas sp. ALB091 TaxID=3403073 RepID=UPI003BB6A246
MPIDGQNQQIVSQGISNMHAIPESPSSSPHAQMVAIKKDADSQTECSPQVSMTNGRVVNCAHPSQLVCPDKIISKTDKSLSDYGVQLVNETLQAGLQGGNKLIRNVAGFALQHLMKSGQFPGVFPDIKQSLMFLAAMPALAGAHPVSTRPVCPDGAPGCSMTYAYSNGVNVADTPYTPPFAYSTTNLNTTSEPTSFYESEGFEALCIFGGMAVLAGVFFGIGCCANVHAKYQQFKYYNPDASSYQLIKAAFHNPNDMERTRYNPEEMYRLPAPSAQRAPAPTAPATCGQGTQTICEHGTQAVPLINKPAPQEQPPTYEEAIAFSVR